MAFNFPVAAIFLARPATRRANGPGRRLVAGLIAARGTKAPANEPNEDKLWFDPF
jgi:hypothetical protein